MSNRQQQQEPLAIVGMSCQLAGGVDSPQALWEVLVNKEVKQSSRVPRSRFDIDAYFHGDAFGQPAAIGSKGGFFLDSDICAFDAEFFGYEAEEAQHMDPQHFRILESVYECLESAGQPIERLRGSNTGCFIGNFSLDQVIKSNRHSYDDRHLHEVIGVDPGLLSARVSYCFDWKGPVFTQNTGCTSSLFALHTAAMALRQGECSSAIVGGVNLLQGPEAYSSYSKFGIMSADSMCHSFDARCNGYCRGEGVGCVFVKLLSDAIRDGDPIRGVVRSIAVNSNGFVPGMPLFVPNQTGLELGLQKAYEQAGLDPKDTAYVETHGIGMVLGEIAEAHAVGLGMNQSQRRPKPLMVGSLKPNFGHQEAASGIFVLIKAALMTEAGVIPAHADYETPHPAIDLEKLNIKPQTETISWPEDLPTRRVGFQSYGWSGTNAHGIVESVNTLYPRYQLGATRAHGTYNHSTNRPFLVPFSAFKAESTKRMVEHYIQVACHYYTADFAYTLGEKRSTFDHRAFVILEDNLPDKPALSQPVVNYGLVGSLPLPEIEIRFDEQANLSRLADEISSVFPSVAKESVSEHAADMVIRLLSEWSIVVSKKSTSVTTGKDSLKQIVVDSSNDSFVGLLRLAGLLFLDGYPVDFAKINAVHSVDWKPKVLVDLPSYHWDHSKRYSHETHANIEHRTNPHPYHNLLGRRVFGLSPRTMVWKNKLSFRDLPKSIPWIPNEKPITSHGLADFVAMIVEASSQAFSKQASAELCIQDVRVFRSLRYGNDVNEIEIQTSLTSDAASSLAIATYRTVIDVLKDGVWTTHCTASVCSGETRAVSPVDAGEAATTECKPLDADSDLVQRVPIPLVASPQARPFPFHTRLIQAALELLQQRVMALNDEKSALYVSRVKFHRPSVLLADYCVIRAAVSEDESSDLRIEDADGVALLSLEGLRAMV